MLAIFFLTVFALYDAYLKDRRFIINLRILHTSETFPFMPTVRRQSACSTAD